MVLENSDVTSFFAWACCLLTTSDVGRGVNVAFASCVASGKLTVQYDARKKAQQVLSKTVLGERNAPSTREGPFPHSSASEKQKGSSTRARLYHNTGKSTPAASLSAASVGQHHFDRHDREMACTKWCGTETTPTSDTGCQKACSSCVVSLPSDLVVRVGEACPQRNKLLFVLRSPPNAEHVDVDEAVFKLVPASSCFKVIWLAFHLYHTMKQQRWCLFSWQALPTI